MAPTAMMMTLSVGEIIGICIGAGCFLLTIVLVPSMLLIKRHYARRGVRNNRRVIAEVNRGECCNREQPQMAMRRSLLLSDNNVCGWDVLSSSDDLQPSSEISKALKRMGHKRLSRKLLSWPLPKRRASKHSVSTQNITSSHLSAINENPVCPIKSPDLDCLQTKDATNAVNPTLFRPSTPQQINSQIATARRTSTSDIQSSAMLKPKPLFSAKHSDLLRAKIDQPKADRSHSVPSILGPIPRDALLGTTSRDRRSNRHARSLSLGNLEPAFAPDMPLPSLPSSSTSEINIRHNTIERNSSHTSTSSVESIGSSILKLVVDPSMRETTECLQRHRDAGLGSHLREKNTDMKGVLLIGPQSTKTTPKLIHSPSFLSSRGSLRSEDILDKVKEGCGDNGLHNNYVNQLSAGCAHPTESARLSQTSNSLNQTEPITTINVLSTPSRNSQMRKVSACGSPPERRRTSVLRDITGNESILPRDPSQTSTQSTMSSGCHGNPFVWESPMQPKRSALKGSPNAKKSRKPKSFVRIASTPTFLGPPDKSASSIQLDEITEEVREMPSVSVRACSINKIMGPFSSGARSLPHPPSSSTFCPELHTRTTVLRASLTPSSPTLSLAPYHVPDQQEKLPQQSNLLSISVPPFPVLRSSDPKSSLTSRAFTCRVDDDAPLFADVPLGAPDSPTIPGLTLLNQRRPTNPDLCFPTIDIHSRSGISEHLFEMPCAAETYSTPSDISKSTSPTFPSGLSPPSKASATTKITRSTMPLIRVRPTPLSSTVHPLNTKPNFPPPIDATSEMLHHPSGPRPAPAQNLMKSVKALRRENSDAMSTVENSRAARRYLGIGREPSPNLSVTNFLYRSSTAEQNEDKDKEAGVLICTSSVWEEGENFWEQVMEESSGESLRVLHEQDGKRGGGNRKDIILRTSNHCSFYDSAGFLK